MRRGAAGHELRLARLGLVQRQRQHRLAVADLLDPFAARRRRPARRGCAARRPTSASGAGASRRPACSIIRQASNRLMPPPPASADSRMNGASSATSSRHSAGSKPTGSAARTRADGRLGGEEPLEHLLHRQAVVRQTELHAKILSGRNGARVRLPVRPSLCAVLMPMRALRGTAAARPFAQSDGGVYSFFGWRWTLWR